MRAGILQTRYSTGYSRVRFVTQRIQPCMAMYDSVHTAMHGDPALSAIDLEILHDSTGVFTVRQASGSPSTPISTINRQVYAMLTYDSSHVRLYCTNDLSCNSFERPYM